MRILLTGAAGFIGSNLVARFLKDGHEVIGVDNFLTGHRRNLAEFMDHPRFTFIEHDVIYPLSINGPLDWVMHFASPASPPKYLKYPIETMRVNSEGTYHLLELARTKGAKFFLASTSEVYGDPQVHPQPESYWGNVNPVGPRSVYDEAKRYAEALTMAYHRKWGLSIRIARIFNTYGPGMDLEDGRVVTNFIRQALLGQPLTVYGDGRQTRSFQYINDLVEGLIRLMAVEFYDPVNLGNPEEYEIGQLAGLILDITGIDTEMIHEPLPENDPRRRRPDISLGSKLLGWRPHVKLSEGIAQVLDHLRNRMPSPPRR